MKISREKVNHISKIIVDDLEKREDFEDKLYRYHLELRGKSPHLQKTLILNILLFVLIVVYEFFISISPLGPIEPSWEFMNIKTTANSLSRSNQFNLFVIFFDALIVVMYDTERSKYIMLVKKQNLLYWIHLK